MLRSYEEIVQELVKKIDTMRQKNTGLGPRRRKRKLSNIQAWKWRREEENTHSQICHH